MEPRVLSSAEVAEKRGWKCCHGCGSENGVYPPPKRSNHPPLCPECHENFVRIWTRESFCWARTRRSWDIESHGVHHTEMRSGFQKKSLSEEEKRNTKRILRKLKRKNLDMLLSEIRYAKQQLRNERRFERDKAQHAHCDQQAREKLGI